MSQASKTDKTDEVIANPSKSYGQPMEVVDDESLDPLERLRILKGWEREAHDLQRAADENMTGGEPSLLADVRKSIDRLCREQGLNEKDCVE